MSVVVSACPSTTDAAIKAIDSASTVPYAGGVGCGSFLLVLGDNWSLKLLGVATGFIRGLVLGS
jgi:hypothetical protein